MEEISPLDDYAMLSVIGKGSYAKVVLVRKKASGQLYAMKSMKKKYIEKKGQVKRVMMEKDILTSIDHQFLIKIHSSFQTEKKLFLVLEYCPGGELFGLLSKRKRLNENEYIPSYPEPASMPPRFCWSSSTFTPRTSYTASKSRLMQP
jgi:serum/glucocorticoid-regulated kinase 2